MAISNDISSVLMGKERFAQLAKAGLPFNPVSGVEFTGENQSRLRRAMQHFEWKDPRFITETEAEINGWVVAPGSWNLEIPVVDPANRSVVSTIKLFNAESVKGMPGLAEMLAMSVANIASMQGLGDLDMDGELVISPAQEIMQKVSEPEAVVPSVEKLAEPDVVENGRFAVKAPYWLDGLHNTEGVALAAEINELVKKRELSENPDSIAELLSAYANVRRLGLEIVPERRYLEDHYLTTNPAEPGYLLNKAFARDKDGAYHPAGGGLPVLVDKGDSLVLKDKGKDTYSAAMELAKAKGWTQIELKGKPAMLANAWLEAKLMGLEVVNYSPTKEDQAKFAEELAKRNAEKAVAESSRSVEQGPEQVVIRPFVDAQGQAKTATVVYTVAQEDRQPDLSFSDAKSAADAFSKIPAAKLPAVIRSVTRTDGYVEADVMVAGTDFSVDSNGPVKSVDAMLDHEFSEAFSELNEKKGQQPWLGAVVDSGMHSGKILEIKDGYAIQKVGRDPDKVVKHDLAKLSRVPKVGEVEDIGYEAGRGILKELGQTLEVDSGRELSR